MSKTLSIPVEVTATLSFPLHAMVGTLGELARELAEGTEVPPEFYFAAGLTILGCVCGTKVKLDVGFDVEPRLYTVLLGDSYGAKKSTAMKKTIQFFEDVVGGEKPKIVYGVGSAEGLTTVFREEPHVLLAFDELRSFVDKTKVQGSVLLPMVTALFEQNKWENVTKSKKHSEPIEDAHLSMIGCCTTATFSDMWTSDAVSIGFPNRLFVVNADRTCKVPWPKQPDQGCLNALRTKLQLQLAKLPVTLSIGAEGMMAWQKWYNELPASEHTKRLDTIGFRLLGLIAITTDKDTIDLETVNAVTAILDYELKVRILTDPIDADNTISKLEEKIRRALTARGPLSKRGLRRATHADRSGLWAFEAAIKNLTTAGDIRFHKSIFELADTDSEECSSITSNVLGGCVPPLTLAEKGGSESYDEAHQPNTRG